MRLKKTLFFFVFSFALFMALALGASAATDGAYLYELDELTGGAVITGYTGSATKLTVPDKVGGKSVTSIGAGAFHDAAFTSVTLPKTVETVGDGAFRNCDKLTTVTFGSDPDSLGVFVFDGCSVLTLKGKHDSTLCAYAHLYNVPFTVTDVSESPFEYTLRGELLTLVRYHGEGGDVTVPETATFNGKKYYVTYIGDNAFTGIRGITSVTLSASVETIGCNSFYGCAELSAIKVNSSNTHFASENGVLYSKDMSVLLLYPPAKNDTAFVVPSSVAEIGYQAFRFNTKLVSVILPASVDTVGYYAFADCPRLRNITVSDGLVYVGAGAFDRTAWMAAQKGDLVYVGNVACACRTDEPVLADTCTAVSAYLFDGSSLTTFDVPDGFRVFNSGALRGCAGLTELHLPDSVEAICAYAFDGCASLDDVYFEGDGINFEPNAFGALRRPLFHCDDESDAYYFAETYSFAVAGKDLRLPTVSVSKTRRNDVTVSWNKVEDATGYVVYYRKTSSSKWTKLTASPVSVTTYTISKLSAATSYCFCVTAVDATRESFMSAYATAVTVNNVLGDVDQDGALTLDDTIRAFRHVSGSIRLPEANVFVSDVNGDGVVTLDDVITIFRAVSGSITLK